MNTPIDTTTSDIKASRNAWLDRAAKLEDALFYIGALAGCAFASMAENAEAGDPEGAGSWTVPHVCFEEVQAILFAIRSTANHVKDAEQ